ncbi:hypothetical protein [Acutalibacter sp. 1XD8-36]|uniref:hypothetical protein n=1 Tax=Acutalibacter sp. 1XD8-36 TaxID=2320852 RepID=UPI00141311DD|nr:hypothetical protein [Acutalibacter sp. 1XD8-36]NBJ90880.1 hypothetical protein [Acutalibacter sp. 1XD8-36]
MELRALVGIAALLIAVAVPSAALTTPKYEEKPTIKYIFDGDEGKRVSDEEFYQVFTPEDEVKAKKTSDNGVVSMQAEDEKPLLYFYFDDSGLYEVSKEQFNEISEEHNLAEVVARDGLVAEAEVPIETLSEKSENTVVDKARKTGNWTITSNTINPNGKTTYSMPDGSSFVVGDGEEITCSIGPDKACKMTIGATGTKTFERTADVDMKNYYGVAIGTTTKGSYKFYAANRGNGFSITVKGGVWVD